MNSNATFICGGEFVPASRYRVHPIANALEREGWDVKVIHGYGALDQKISQQFIRRSYRATCRVFRALGTASLRREGPILVQRLALPWLGMPEIRLARRNNSLVFDFDDAVFLGSNGKENLFRRKALDAVFKESAHVVAGNSWLAKNVTADVPVSVIPTCIDTGQYLPTNNKNRDGILNIGWIGTSGNFSFLWQLEKPLAQLRDIGFIFDFKICSDAIDNELFRRLGATFEKWTPQGELSFLQSLDIGLMPLANSDWCRGKCSFKIVQYMSVGCPAVASAVGMNLDVLEGDVGGRLVYGEEWFEPLAELLASSRARDEASAQARARAVNQFDISIAIESYKSVFSKLNRLG